MAVPYQSTTTRYSTARRRGSILLLALASGLLLMDLSLISLLIEPMRKDLNFSDAQLGLLQGAFPTMTYALCAIPFGLLADRFNRSRLILGALLMWIAALLLMAFAPSFAYLAVAKVIIGGVQAALLTAPMSMVADLSDRKGRSMAVSMLVFGQSLGSGLGFIVGGAVFSALSTLPGFSAWRVTLLAFAATSLVLVPFIAFLKEPPRTERGIKTSDLRSLLTVLRSHARSLWPLFLGYTFFVVAASVLLVWTAPSFMRVFSLSELSVGNIVGIVSFLGGIIGAVLAGALLERSRRRGGQGAGVIIIASLVIGGSTLMTTLPSLGLATSVFSIGMVAYSVGATVVSAVLLIILPNELRGLGTGLLILLGVGPGLSLGPSLVAFTSDSLGDNALGEAMATVGLTGGLISAALYVAFAIISRRRAAQGTVDLTEDHDDHSRPPLDIVTHDAEGQ